MPVLFCVRPSLLPENINRKIGYEQKMEPYWWFALKSVPMVGNVVFRRLLERFGSPEKVFSASEAELAGIKGISPTVATAIRTHDYRRFAEQESDALVRAGARIVTLLSAEYPEVLMQIPDAPPFIYVRGELRRSETAIAVVGSRRASTYGIITTTRLATDLAEKGITIVSGMARGVDTAAHNGALKGGGRSIGVLGCGVDVLYPVENRKLFQEMVEKGALVSEFPMATPPLAENFPRRNRIISGLSRGVLVVEAMENSGSLITAQFALEQGREVFAVPGNITSGTSRGANRLIKQGAKLVECINDILEELPQPSLGSAARTTGPGFNLAPGESGIYNILTNGPDTIDEIIVKSGLTAGDVSAILLRLELRGAVIQLPGKVFAIS